MFPSRTPSFLKTITRPTSHTCTICAGVNMEGMWDGNPNHMRYGKALTNPSGFFLFIPCSHACKYSYYHLAQSLSWLGNEEKRQLTNAPFRMLASSCIPLPHKSVDNDRFISESPSTGPVLTCRDGNTDCLIWFFRVNIILSSEKNKFDQGIWSCQMSNCSPLSLTFQKSFSGISHC